MTCVFPAVAAVKVGAPGTVADTAWISTCCNVGAGDEPADHFAVELMNTNPNCAPTFGRKVKKHHAIPFTAKFTAPDVKFFVTVYCDVKLLPLYRTVTYAAIPPVVAAVPMFRIFTMYPMVCPIWHVVRFTVVP